MSMASSLDVAAVSLGTRTIRKLHFRLLPFLLALYVICFLDRVNIGIAALTMSYDLGINSEQFGLLTGIFFLGYFLFEVPSNLLLHKIGARVWLARILISWGIVATLTGLVHSIPQLYLARFLLGLAEAGYVPGVYLYLTYWFPERERARAIAVFLIGLPVANILGAPLSGYILDRVHWLGIASWRWLLMLEGMPPILFGLLTYIVLPSRPCEAKFLAEDEKEWVQSELKGEEVKKAQQCRHSVLQTVTSGRVWYLTLLYAGLMIARYTMSFWTPQIIKSLSAAYSNTSVGLLIAIPSLVSAVAMVLISHSSDRRLERKFHAALPVLAGAVALAMLGLTRSPILAVTLLSLVEVALCGFLAPFWAMPSDFLAGSAVATGFAMINSIGNLGGFVGPATVGLINQKTGSIYSGLRFVSVCMLVSFALLVFLPVRTPRSN
jgi:MFS transporter, ACS family, tartrate transporter